MSGEKGNSLEDIWARMRDLERDLPPPIPPGETRTYPKPKRIPLRELLQETREVLPIRLRVWRSKIFRTK